MPVKFLLTDASGNAVQPLTAPAWVTPQKGVATSLPVDESVYSLPPDSGSVYRLSDDAVWAKRGSRTTTTLTTTAVP